MQVTPASCSPKREVSWPCDLTSMSTLGRLGRMYSNHLTNHPPCGATLRPSSTGPYRCCHAGLLMTPHHPWPLIPWSQPINVKHYTTTTNQTADCKYDMYRSKQWMTDDHGFLLAGCFPHRLWIGFLLHWQVAYNYWSPNMHTTKHTAHSLQTWDSLESRISDIYYCVSISHFQRAAARLPTTRLP